MYRKDVTSWEFGVDCLTGKDAIPFSLGVLGEHMCTSRQCVVGVGNQQRVPVEALRPVS